MQRACATAILFVLVAAAQPQQPAAQRPDSAPQGLEAEWDIAPVLRDIGAGTGRLLQTLEGIDARAWVDQGASETYAEQLQSCKDQARITADAARDLARNPERLAASIDLFIRLQSLDVMLLSLEEGIRKYQAPAEAQALAELAAQSSAGRERFQHYIVNLANVRERELAVMDKEAQRCRGLATAPSPVSSKPVRKK